MTAPTPPDPHPSDDADTSHDADTPDASDGPHPPGGGAHTSGDGADTSHDDRTGSAPPLSGRDRAVLAVERQSWAGPGAKERAIREQLGIAPTRYYQLLNALIDDRRALAEDPVTVNRLRRVRDARRGRR